MKNSIFLGCLLLWLGGGGCWADDGLFVGREQAPVVAEARRDTTTPLLVHLDTKLYRHPRWTRSEIQAVVQGGCGPYTYEWDVFPAVWVTDGGGSASFIKLRLTQPEIADVTLTVRSSDNQIVTVVTYVVGPGANTDPPDWKRASDQSPQPN